MKFLKIIQRLTQSVIILGVLACAAFALVACGSESGAEASDTSVLSEVETSFELGKCRNELNGTSVYVSQENVNYTCLNGSWIKEESVVTSSFSGLFSSSTINEHAAESQGQEFGNNVSSPFYSSSSERDFFSSSSLNQPEIFSSNISSSSSSNDCVIEVCSLEELPKCSVDYKTATVKGEGFLYYCLNGNWVNSGGYYDGGCTIRAKCPKSSSSAASSSSVVSNIYDCNVYKCMSTEYLNQDMLAAGKYGEFLDVRDSQVYRTIQIGDQVWMAQNMNYSDPKYIYGSRDVNSDCRSKCNVVGRVYNLQYATCPSGWHIPSEAEFETLFKTVGASRKYEKTDGSMLISAKVSGDYDDPYGYAAYSYNSGTVAADSVFVGGSEIYDGYLTSDDCSEGQAVFWTSTSVQYAYFEAYSVSIGNSVEFTARSYLKRAFHIRCVKN